MASREKDGGGGVGGVFGFGRFNGRGVCEN